MRATLIISALATLCVPFVLAQRPSNVPGCRAVCPVGDGIGFGAAISEERPANILFCSYRAKAQDDPHKLFCLYKSDVRGLDSISVSLRGFQLLTPAVLLTDRPSRRGP